MASCAQFHQLADEAVRNSTSLPFIGKLAKQIETSLPMNGKLGALCYRSVCRLVASWSF
jgi:hypothetical protein